MIVSDPRLGATHAFFTREGGVSRSVYESLNAGLGSNDEPANVEENRARMAAKLGVVPDRLVTPYQVHSPDAVATDGPWAGDRPEADAVATATSGLAVGVVTADCGPVLFADTKAGVVAAAHAGWKGALGGVTDAAIARMEELGASRSNIVAALGPCIGPVSYEVDDGFKRRFLAADAANRDFFEPGAREGHPLFDLPAYILRRLEASGVDAAWTGHDTYEDEAQFFSFRRTTHRAEPDYGRQLSAIVAP